MSTDLTDVTRRSLEHFEAAFSRQETVGRRVLAEAIYAGRHGDADDATTDEIAGILEEMPDHWDDAVDAQRACRLAKLWGMPAEELCARLRGELEAAFADPATDQAVRKACDRRCQESHDRYEPWRVMELFFVVDEADRPYSLDDLRATLEQRTLNGWLLAALDLDPIPQDAIAELCGYLAEDGGRGPEDQGMSKLADRVGCAHSTVSRWIHGDQRCTGASATAVRHVAKDVLADGYLSGGEGAPAEM